ncbi:hypothetical protein NDU88_002976 [Pleurodeles waltl]|uniref:Uncharacterized protein n=1 Tax=Pleurodeles waltl TaxID=8319 RepID=A0AAV7VCV3_PLEWA|nr:hypothetical protein NDU88_002976 [Pleurodeles waltl]
MGAVGAARQYERRGLSRENHAHEARSDRANPKHQQNQMRWDAMLNRLREPGHDTGTGDAATHNTELALEWATNELGLILEPLVMYLPICVANGQVKLLIDVISDEPWV